MKIGDYVRTKEFGIQKVKWFDNEEPILENGFTALQSSGYKSSPNIIDLIEVGDYVNGSKVIEVNKDNESGYVSVEYSIMEKGEICIAVLYGEEQIKSIVTKEQFENIEYKI